MAVTNGELNVMLPEEYPTQKIKLLSFFTKALLRI